MERLAARDLRQLLAPAGEASAPHVSIYVPLGTTVEERERARERFARLVGRAEALLGRHYPQVASAFVRPIKSLAERLAKLAPAKGLAVFCSPRRTVYVPLERKVGELAIVAESFHVKPLLPLAQADEAFFLLALEPGIARLYAGSRDDIAEKEAFRALVEVDDTRRVGRGARHAATPRDIAAFYKDIDRRVKKLVGRRRTPVVLAGTEEAIGIYRSVSRLTSLPGRDIRVSDAAAQGLTRLYELAWPIAAEALVGRKRKLTRAYKVSRLRGRVVERLDEIASAADKGRVETLLLEAGVHVWGRIEPGARIKLLRSQDEGPADDLLDDLAEMVLAKGGKVHVLESMEMPTRAPAVAILR